jgi:shikimate dehydrogenase
MSGAPDGAGYTASRQQACYSIDFGPGLPDWTGMTSGTKPPAACLIGWPAAHSRSPLIHHYWLRTLGIAGGYVIEAVPPDEFKDFIFRLSLRGFVGANVTIPHKERALSLSKPDARARAVGAANTLWFENGELCSTNTDVEGFINNLDARASGWDKCEEALVLGAGGSSRAVLFGLLDRGIQRVHLVNRTIERARALADEFGASVVPVAWDAVGDLLPRAGLLVNTTSLGMKGQPPLELAVTRRRRRWGVRAARHAIARRGPRPRAEDGRRARHAAAPGGARLRIVVRAAPRGDGGTSRAGRGRSHEYMIG